MKIVKLGMLAACACILAACGGGGGGGGNDAGGKPTDTTPQATLTLDARSVSASATYWDIAPTSQLSFTVENPPADGIYVGTTHTGAGISFVDLQPLSETRANLVVQFQAPSAMASGTHTGSIELILCYDSACARHIRNSPATISASYTVEAASSSVSANVSTVSVNASMLQPSQPTATVDLSIANPGPIPPYVAVSYGSAASFVQSISPVTLSASAVRLDLLFGWSNSMQVGTQTQNAQIDICYDFSCQRHLAGSPIVLPLSYTITNDAVPEPGLTALPFLSRSALSHDVIDAEYSGSLEAIVMVSSYPKNALHIFDPSTGEENTVALVKVPTSVSVSPDGTSAAVGHDALVSIVDLSTVGNSTSPAPIVLNITADAFDTVLDGRGYVHVMPRIDQWVQLHSVEIATNTETLNSSIRAGTRARLHPSGDYIYGADNGLSPSDIEKYDITAGPATFMYDSPYHGDYGMCGDLWFKESGSTIYTACGNTFRASAVQNQDMVYSGKLQLSTSQYYAYMIQSLSQSDETKDIALIEYDSYNCASWNNQGQCYTRLGVYESDFLQRQSVYSIPPIAVAGTSYSQRGLFVFHSANGAHRYLISRLFGMPNANAEYYLTVQQ